ncbi:MAG: hypothetical protein A3K03_03175 [Bdellovibrionales bacterium RIFOXYD1_FULL_44_7]|nr:MAG: hypothetical protein A3K03_03175 [Bdellovibrionales bacterium RIFOXYD1_FULL_44_7]
MEFLPEAFKSLSDPTRIQMLALLCHYDELCVCDFIGILKIPQPKASRHLQTLFRAGLVRAQKRATWTYYRIFKSSSETSKFQAAILPLIASSLSSNTKVRAKVWLAKRGGNACSIKLKPRKTYD